MRLRMGSFGTPKNSINHTGKAKLWAWGREVFDTQKIPLNMLGETKPCVWGRKVCKTKKGSILHTRGS